MANNNSLEYPEAVKLFMDAGLSETTFRRKVAEKDIKKTLPEGRVRGALYSMEDIHRVIRELRKEKPQSNNLEETGGETDWIQEKDLPYILAYDIERYGIENTVDTSITYAWWKKNPYMCRILYDKNDRRNIWGTITVMPMKEETILRLLRGEIEEKAITPDDILTYEPGMQYIGYIPSAAVKEEHRPQFRKLMESVFEFWYEQYPQIQIVKLYAFAASDDGWNLIKHLFFAPRYDLGENAFELNPYQRNPSKVLQRFQKQIQQKQ